MSGDYEVGYGKPPVHTRFKKGQSANPGGKPGPKKTRRQRFAQLLEAMLLESTQKTAMTRCENRFAEAARGMVLDVVRGKTAAMRMTFALLDELDGDTNGRRQPRGIDQMLEEAEWADEDATWCESERDTDSRSAGISEAIIEEPLQRWSEIAQEWSRGLGQIDGSKVWAVEARALCGSERDIDSPSAGISQRIIEEPLQRQSDVGEESAHGEVQIGRPDETGLPVGNAVETPPRTD